MKIKLLIISISIIIISFIFITNDKKENLEINIEPNKNEIKGIIEEEIIEKEVIENESNIELITENMQDNIQDNVQDSRNSSNPTSNINKDDKKSNNNSNTNVVEENKVESNSTNVENNSTQIENNSTPKAEKEEINNPWDDLGITEYDYYNKPMWSWARVDYSIKEYETQEKAYNACIEAGNNMIEDILSFSCTSINSYSGDYLGEMLRVKKG